MAVNISKTNELVVDCYCMSISVRGNGLFHTHAYNPAAQQFQDSSPRLVTLIQYLTKYGTGSWSSLMFLSYGFEKWPAKRVFLFCFFKNIMISPWWLAFNILDIKFHHFIILFYQTLGLVFIIHIKYILFYSYSKTSCFYWIGFIIYISSLLVEPLFEK